jgi:hypothetical protein
MQDKKRLVFHIPEIGAKIGRRPATPLSPEASSSPRQ